MHPGDPKTSVIDTSRKAHAKLTEGNQGGCQDEKLLIKVVIRCVKSSGKAGNAADYA